MYLGLPTTPIILCVVVSDVEIGVEVIYHSTFRSRYPFKKRIHVKKIGAKMIFLWGGVKGF